MTKSNHRKHKRNANGCNGDECRKSELALLEQRADAGSQNGKHGNQPQKTKDPGGRDHSQLYRALPVSRLRSVVFACRYTARMSASPTAASAAATAMEKIPKIIPVDTPLVCGPKRQKATKLRLAAFNISSMPTSTRMVFLRVNAPARPTANNIEDTSKHAAKPVIAGSPSWQQSLLL